MLYESSRRVYEVSRNTDLVSRYRIELPAGWRNTECTMNLNVAEGQISRQEDLLVGSQNPLLGAQPFAEQFAGCGIRGQRVQVPFSILTDSAEMSAAALNKTVLEVLRWRYGVFTEAGINGDAMYPANATLGLQTVANEGCTAETQLLNNGFCPINNYNSAASTKQNLLCEEKPAKKVIHDLSADKDPVHFTSPEFEYILPSETARIVLVIEQSPSMWKQWNSVLSSTFQYINSLAEGVELAILSYTSNTTVHLEPTRVVGGNREGLHYRIPRRVSIPEAKGDANCIECALEHAIDIATNTTTLVLISSSALDKKSEELMKLGPLANIITRQIVVGTYKDQKQENSIVHPASVHTDSLVNDDMYLINEKQNQLNITSEMNQALASLTNNYPSNKFHQETLATVDVEGSFSVEPSLSSNLWIQILLDETSDINVFEIRSPSGQVFCFPKYDAGLVYFSLLGPRETGVWTYRIKFYASAAAEHKMILECWGSQGTTGSSSIQLTSWSHVTPGVNQPANIYARLEQDGLPVLNARLVALVRLPGQTANDNVEPVRVELVDNGSGYPDITQGDGVYSAYFADFSDKPGFYSVTIEAINNSSASVINTRKLENATVTSGGSSLPLEPSVPLEPFTRFSTSPSFYLNSVAQFYISSGKVQKKDTLAPNRITDFRLANYFNNSLFVTLAWSAPGNDFNTNGKAFRYEIRCFTARTSLQEANFNEQGILVHQSLVPTPENPGKEQRCTVGVPWPEEIFYYAIVAYDEAGNRGKVSNIISVYVKEPITTSTEDATTISLEMTDVSKSLHLKSFLHSESLMYIIAGIISLILIIVVIILTVIVRRLGVCTKKEPGVLAAEGQSHSGGGDTPSLPDLCHEQSFMRNSISYMSGYDLPEMLEYTLRSPQKARAQENNNNNSGQHAKLYGSSLTEQQYSSLGHNVNSLVQPSSLVHHSSLIQPSSLIQTNKDYANHVQRSYNSYYNKPPSPVTVTSPQKHHLAGNESPSISPVNSTLTAGGQSSTDCSVSVSGSDHDDHHVSTLQVVTPHQAHVVMAGGHRSYDTQYTHQRQDKPKKIPPAVPNKTVHASLV